MRRPGIAEQIGGWSTRHARTATLIWIAFVVAAIGGGSLVAERTLSDSQLHQIGRPADRSGGTPQMVTLAPRQTGHTLVQFTDIGVIDPAVCKPATAEVLRVYPPGARHYAEISWQFGACRSKAVTFMDVQPVQARVGIPGF
jgi:Protein of unknown function (DUF4232)